MQIESDNNSNSDTESSNKNSGKNGPNDNGGSNSSGPSFGSSGRCNPGGESGSSNVGNNTNRDISLNDTNDFIYSITGINNHYNCKEHFNVKTTLLEKLFLDMFKIIDEFFFLFFV